MSEYIRKSHNVTVLLYHLVFPAKYRRAVFVKAVDGVLKEAYCECEKTFDKQKDIYSVIFGFRKVQSIYQPNKCANWPGKYRIRAFDRMV